jgi:hypothetical protein
MPEKKSPGTINPREGILNTYGIDIFSTTPAGEN